MSDIKNGDFFVEIRDMIGQIIYARKFNSANGEKVKIDLSENNKGIYFLSVNSPSGRVTKEWVIY